ncbi:hypothetical protein [Rubritalea tangerina]|uniref:hypothetical protein n=1 Tax=Rubritalea tangerina TaxID=430798 RepID=UPI0036090A81
MDSALPSVLGDKNPRKCRSRPASHRCQPRCRTRQITVIAIILITLTWAKINPTSTKLQKPLPSPCLSWYLLDV